MKIEGIVEYVEIGEIAKGIKNDGKYYRRHLGWTALDRMAWR